MGMLQDIKFSVVELVSNLSSTFQNIFGHSSDANGDKKATNMDRTLGVGASFMGLATLVVMVVLLKRV